MSLPGYLMWTTARRSQHLIQARLYIGEAIINWPIDLLSGIEVAWAKVSRLAFLKAIIELVESKGNCRKGNWFILSPKARLSHGLWKKLV